MPGRAEGGGHGTPDKRDGLPTHLSVVLLVLGFNPRTRRTTQKIRATSSPPLHPMPSSSSSRHRIHRKALRRGGIGAGREGRTQDFTAGVRRKWSPSGEGGNRRKCRTGRSSGVPVRHTRGPATGETATMPFLLSQGGGEDGDILTDQPCPAEGAASRPERPKLRIKTAERGAGKRQYPLLLRGNFQRPVRVNYTTDPLASR